MAFLESRKNLHDSVMMTVVALKKKMAPCNVVITYWTHDLFEEGNT